LLTPPAGRRNPHSFLGSSGTRGRKLSSGRRPSSVLSSTVLSSCTTKVSRLPFNVHKSTSGYGEWLLTTSPLGILLGVRDFSPRQYNQITIVLASNEIGIFSLEISVPPGLGAGLSGRDEVRMEDLLQAQFDNQLNLLLFDGAVTFSIDELIKQINKSEWAKH
jgi:hypothetical protein